MRDKKLLILSALLVAIIASSVLARIKNLEDQFNKDAARMKAQTASYDQDFISMVNRLETELAARASFPYLGGKDPMTGKIRYVVEAPVAPKTKANGKKNTKVAKHEEPVEQPTPVVAPPVDTVETKPATAIKDPVRLTAIIYDDFKKAFTAIMMVGERSYSVEVGDKINGRITKQINAKQVTLEDDQKAYQYDISGKISNRVK